VFEPRTAHMRKALETAPFRVFAPGRARSGLERRMERAEICLPSAPSAEEGGSAYQTSTVRAPTPSAL
jgi:hypothetical protein